MGRKRCLLFADVHHRRFPGIGMGRLRTLLVTLHAVQVLEKLVANRLHRLYVVDAELRPIGIVTLTDILRVVTQQSIG